MLKLRTYNTRVGCGRNSEGREGEREGRGRCFRDNVTKSERETEEEKRG